MLKLRFKGGRILTHFGTPFADFLREMTKNRHLTNRWVFSFQFFPMMFVYYKSTAMTYIVFC